MHWSKRESEGLVRMRIFAQRCRKCAEPPFEAPEFTEENVSRILNNLVFRILKKCYGEGFKSMEEIPTIKDVSLKGPHDADNCEACLWGFCAQCESDAAEPSPTAPPLPTLSTPAFAVPTYKPSLSRSSAMVDAGTGHPGVKKGGVHSPGLPEAPRAQRPRANTSHRQESVITVSPPREDHPSTQRGVCFRFGVFCCAVILILAFVAVVVVVVMVKLST